MSRARHRGIGQSGRCPEGLPFDIVTERGPLASFIDDLRHRLDGLSVEFIQLINVGKNLIEIFRHSPDFFRRQAKFGEVRYVPNFLLCDFQAFAFLRAAL